MRSDRKKVNCHDAKAYLPAGELALFVVLAHVHTHVCVCVCVCVACPRGTEYTCPEQGACEASVAGSGPSGILPVVKPLFFEIPGANLQQGSD